MSTSSRPAQRQRPNSPKNSSQSQQQQHQNQQPQHNAAAANAAALAAAAAMKQAASQGIVRICGAAPSECGYCKGARARLPNEAQTSSHAYSLLGDFMTPETYEGFVYRGWRRSGTYLYKPNNWQSCCPALTIRLPVRQFMPTKSQRRVAKKMELLLQPNHNNASPSSNTSNSTMTPNTGDLTTTSQTHKKKVSKRKHPGLDSSTSSFAEQLVEHGHILEQLHSWTQPILFSLLEAYKTTLKLDQIKVALSFKIKPPQGKRLKKQCSQDDSNNDIGNQVTVCTTVCAALAGQSKGSIDRDRLSHQLTEQLKALHAGKSHPLPTQSTLSFTVRDVYRHAKSGQVFLDLQVPSQNQFQNGNRNSNGAVANTTTNASKRDISMQEPSMGKLQQWLQTHGPGMAPFMSNNDNAIPTGPPYAFHIETMPAHKSALDPEVHKLYFLYQHKVHQDSDPFTCDLSTPLHNSNSSMGAAPGGVPGDDAAMEDDEWSTPATSDGNDPYSKQQQLLQERQNREQEQQQQPGNEAPKPSPISPGPSNEHYQTPEGYVDKAKRMLQAQYPGVEPDRLKQIVKSYGSFYQFLVESPFVIPPNDPHTTTTSTPPSTVEAVTKTLQNTQRTVLPCGTYHQHYRIGGMLIAVGVVDVLPQGLSSVYLFYHPQFAHDLCPLGKYAILQEIEFAKQLHLPYYYLGYYIESCTKMRYKAEYRPSELLCPTTYRWVDALLAQRILQTFSPVHHCCQLYYEDQTKLEHDLKHPPRIRSNTSNSNKRKEQSSDDEVLDWDEDDEDDPDDMSLDQMPPVKGNRTLTNNNGNTTTKSKVTKSILKKPTPPPPPNPYVEQVKMDVGVGVPVTLSMLHERGRETVRPLLEDYVNEAGPHLSGKCLVKFT